MQYRRLAVRGIITDGNKIFGMQLKNAVAKGNNWWCTPGGGVEPHEGLVEALERELLEETGIKPVIGNLLFVQQFTEDNTEQLEFFFHIKNTEDYRNVNLENTSHGPIEIANYDFIDPEQENLLPADLQKMDIKAHIEQNQPVKIFVNL